MASAEIIYHSGRTSFFSLGDDVVKARERYNKEVDKAIQYGELWYNHGMSVINEHDKTTITWTDENKERHTDTYLFRPDDNNTYA